MRTDLEFLHNPPANWTKFAADWNESNPKRVPGALSNSSLAVYSATNRFHQLPFSVFIAEITWLEIALQMGAVSPLVFRSFDFDTGVAECPDVVRLLVAIAAAAAAARHAVLL